MTYFLLIMVGVIATAAVTTMFWFFANKRNNFAITHYIFPTSILLYCIIFFFGTTGLQGKEFLALATLMIWASQIYYQTYLSNKTLTTTAPFDSKALVHLQKKSLLNFLLVVPFFLISLGTTNRAGSFDLLAFTIAYLSIFGSIVADYQYRFFYSIPLNHGKACTEGLWAFSKRPNHIFELLVWVGFALLAVSAPYGALALIAPLARFYMLAIKEIPAGKGLMSTLRSSLVEFFARPNK